MRKLSDRPNSNLEKVPKIQALNINAESFIPQMERRTRTERLRKGRRKQNVVPNI